MGMALKSLLAVLLISGLLGCAGKDFVRPGSEDFKLGQTTYSQVVQRMGEPRRAAVILKNGKNVKAVTYVYASTGGEPLEAGVTAAHGLTYYFYNDTLIGQEFISSFKSDNSNFDEKRPRRSRKAKRRVRTQLSCWESQRQRSFRPWSRKPPVKQSDTPTRRFVAACSAGSRLCLRFCAFRSTTKASFQILITPRRTINEFNRGAGCFSRSINYRAHVTQELISDDVIEGPLLRKCWTLSYCEAICTAPAPHVGDNGPQP